MVLEKYKDILIKIVNKHLPECKIYLFGSRVTDDHPKFSDIDIAIKSEKALELNVMGKIKDEVEESRIPLFVDVVDFHNVDDKMRDQILKYGVLWKS